MSSQFTARIYWLLNKTLVAEGLPDSWEVRRDGRRVGSHLTLDQVAQLQIGTSNALVEVQSSEFEDTRSPFSRWTHVLPERALLRAGRAFLLGLSVAGAVCFAFYIFHVNHAHPIKKLTWTSAVGLFGAPALYVGLRWIFGAFVWFCHLFCDHSRPFLKGALLGGLGGMLISAFLWHPSTDRLRGALMAARTTAFFSLVAACALAQREHDHFAKRSLDRLKQNGGAAQKVVTDRLPGLPQFPTDRFRAILAAVLLSALTVQIPVQRIVAGEDASWASVLSYARIKGWQFGKDIAFTYGPLGFLISPYYCYGDGPNRLIVRTVVSFVTALGLCLLAWRLRLFWRWLLLTAFAFFCSSIHVEGSTYAAADIYMFVGVLSWGLLCLLEAGRNATIYCAFLTGLAIFGSLAKVSFLPIAAATVGAIAANMFLVGRKSLGAVIVAAYFLGFVLGWWIAGQDLRNLGHFFVQSAQMVRGNQDTMFLDAPGKAEWVVSLVCCIAWLTSILASSGAFDGDGRHAILVRRILTATWLSGLLFIVWKYGIGRADAYHLKILVGFVPVLALSSLCLVNTSNKTFPLLNCLALACTLIPVFVLDATFYRGYSASRLIHPLSHLPWNLRCLCKPTEYWKDVPNPTPLPKLDGIIGSETVDVFGPEPATALLNGLNYRTRPVFQSYAAYNALLMGLNEQFYLSEQAPKNVLFTLAPIDGRLPSLEDAMVLRDLLINYAPAASEREYLLLKSVRKAVPRLRLLQSGSLPIGSPIPVQLFGNTNLWLEIDLGETLAGRVRRLVYKPPEVALKVWNEKGQAQPGSFRAPPAMLSAGFVASPLLLDNNDIKSLYAGNKVSRPAAYSIECHPGTARFWKDTFQFRIYAIEDPLDASR